MRDCTQGDRQMLDNLRGDIRALKPKVRKIHPRTATTVSLVASDGGNNQLRFDPFNVQLVRVVDSYGKLLCFDTVSASTDLDALDKAQFNADGTPRTVLGKMMADLGKKRLCEIAWHMPEPSTAKDDPAIVKQSWVKVYRDMCEWAALYDLICHYPFSADTLIVRDGPLRSLLFRGALFDDICTKIEAAIDRIYRKDRRRVFLAGIIKHSKIMERYGLAFALEKLFPSGDALYVEIPARIVENVVTWDEREGEGESRRRHIAGTMYLVRFGHHTGDPVWCADILKSQSGSHQEVFAHLQQDAISGFPIPYYPLCLQRAHEHAQIANFDYDILQDEVKDAIRDILLEGDKPSFDELPLRHSNIANRRYG